MMPADASGVTTDDQGSPHDESGHPAVAEGTSAGRAADARRPGEDAPAGGSDTSDLHGGNGAPAAAEPGQPFPTPAPHRDGGAPGAPDGSGDPTMPETGEIEGFGDATTQIDDPRPELAPAGLVPAGLPPGAEPPPAPVLIPTGGRFGRPRRALGRQVSRRRARASRRGLRVNQRLWSIDPWSVFKVSALFYLCLGLIIVVAGTLLYNAGRSVGTIEQFESFVTRMGAYGECTAKSEVPEGTEFREDDDTCGEGEVLVGGFMLDDGTLFRSGAIAVAVLVVSGAVGNVLLVVLLNLLNELTGGLRHTIIKEPVARAPTGGAARAPDPGRRPGSGSPPLPREG